MANKHFSFPPEWLEADTAEINFGEETIKFTEFSRSDLYSFIEDCVEQKNDAGIKKLQDKSATLSRKLTILRQKQQTGESISESDIPSVEDYEMPPVKEISEPMIKLVCKYLSKACRGEKPATFFEKLDLSIEKYARLYWMLCEINHIEEISGSQGNVMLIPNLLSKEWNPQPTIGDQQ